MSLVLDPLPVPLVETDGELRVTGTRVSLQFIVYEYRNGASAEEIATRFPTVALPQVHALLAYYLANKKSVDAYIEEKEAQATDIRKEIETHFPPDGIREKLLAKLKST